MAETDPRFDVAGWDAAVKVSALASVLMDYPDSRTTSSVKAFAA
jgi:homoserine dehydrogenase